MGASKNRQMYNAGQKQEYINHETINATGLRQYFERLSGIEELYGKDIADMSAEEARAALTSLNIRSITTRRHFISLVKAYIDWAIYNGKTRNDNKIATLKPEDIGSHYSVVTQMLKSPEQIEHILGTAFGSVYAEQENRQARDSLIFWLLYAGMTINELELLKKTDINYAEKTVASPIEKDVVHSVDDNIVSLWRKCCEITYIERVGTRWGKDIIQAKLAENDYLLRIIAGTKDNADRTFGVNQMSILITKIFRAYFEATGEYIVVTPSNIKLSGIFYRLYQYEKSGNEVTVEIFSEYLRLKYETRVEMMDKSKRFRVDYAEWKDAFGYNE